MSLQEVPLESLHACFQGVFPSPVATCGPDGMPNITYMSLVHYVDRDRVALSRQFFRKTAANLDENPAAQVLAVHPDTMAQYLLDLEYLRTETAGTLFDAVSGQLEGSAAHTGVPEAARLRGVDLFRVLSCRPLRAEDARAPARPGRDLMHSLDKFVGRVAAAVDRDDAIGEILTGLADLFGITHSAVFVVEGESLRTISHKSTTRPVEVDLNGDAGIIGVAARRRHVVCVASVARTGVMGSAIDRGRDSAEHARPVPLLDGVQSMAAVPLELADELVGILYMESEQPGFFGANMERLLRILGSTLSVGLAAVEASGAPAQTRDGRSPIDVTYYQADDSVFVNEEYVTKGAPGRILWKLLREHDADGRVHFTNRELRLDERLELPPGNDNLDSRLIALRRRLAGGSWGIGLERIGRGRLALHLERPLALAEVSTDGPMRREPTLPGSAASEIG